MNFFAVLDTAAGAAIEKNEFEYCDDYTGKIQDGSPVDSVVVDRFAADDNYCMED